MKIAGGFGSQFQVVSCTQTSESEKSSMGFRHLLVGAILGSFVFAIAPVAPQQAEAAQTTVKKKTKKPANQNKKKQQYPHGKKKYPWGEPNAGWDDRCIFYFDTYDGWIPPMCRPYGRRF